MRSIFENDRLRKVSKRVAERYIKVHKGYFDEMSVTVAGSDAYKAVWIIDVLRDTNGRLMGEIQSQ